MHCAGMSDWAGIVLAGGRSVRMGRDKAELPWSTGQTFLDHAIAVLVSAGCSQVIVSGDRAGYDHVPDRWLDSGPLGGLLSVLSARPQLVEHWLMVIPVDMPWLGTGTLSRLAAVAGKNNSGAVFDTSPLPMMLAPGFNRLAVARSILSENGQHSLYRLVEQLGLARIPTTPQDRLENINRPAEYLSVVQRHGTQRDPPVAGSPVSDHGGTA